MALPELLRALGEQAAERRAAESSRAREAAERIREESRGNRDRRREEFLSRVRQEEEEIARRTLSRAQSEAVTSVLIARGRLLDRVRAGVATRIDRAGEDSIYMDVLPAEVRAALGRLPAGEVWVSAAPALVPYVERAMAGFASVSVEPDDDVGPGFRAFSHAHDMEIDGTLHLRLSLGWPRLAVAVLAEVAP